MISRKFRYPKNHSFFLLGPRGTGKSYFIRYEFPHAIYINLLEDQVYQPLLANPSRLKDMIPSKFRDWVIIDEIQKIPALLDEVHRLIEEARLKFVLTGSSVRKLKRAGVNLLAGRAYTHHAFPLTALELQDNFEVKKALQSGLLPKAYLEENFKSYLSSYVATYLKEEIQQEGMVRNISGFARFLEAASFSQGQVLNFSKVAEDCSIERKTVGNYFQMLEDLLLAHFIDVFSLRAKRELIKHRKFYFFDVGVFLQTRLRGPLDSEQELMGAAVETLVLQEILARIEYQNWDYKLFFWHTKNHVEVDFILYGQRGLVAIEVKASSRLRKVDYDGLLEFKKDYPKAKLILVYNGSEKKILHDIEIIPLEVFLKRMENWC